MKKSFATRFVWKGLKKQVGAWAKQCIKCQSSNIQTHVRSPTEPFTATKRQFQYDQVDDVRLLPLQMVTHTCSQSLTTPHDGWEKSPSSIQPLLAAPRPWCPTGSLTWSLGGYNIQSRPTIYLTSLVSCCWFVGHPTSLHNSLLLPVK